MPKFRKKPITIEAIQWDGTDECWIKIQNFAYGLIDKDDFRKDKIKTSNGNIYITTLEGEMCAMENDWIIKGVKGEYYPIKNEIFLETYEEANVL